MRRVGIKILILPLALGTLGSTLVPALADGGYLVRTFEEKQTRVSSDAQKALIIWEGGTETLHVRSSYRGPAAEFAWVIPVPAPPKVERSDWKLFTAAEEATRPQIVVTRTRFVGHGCGCSTTAVPDQSGPVETGVRRLDSLDIRELHVEVLAASDAGGFVAWLKTNGYAVSTNAEPVLEDYVQRKFFFVAVRVREAGFWATLKTPGGVVTGELTPLAISFPAAKPFYPLAISAISAAPENELLLLVAAGQRLEAAEYPCPELTSADIRRAVTGSREGGANPKSFKNLNLAPAVKTVNQRLRSQGLVVETVADLAWSGPEHRRLGPVRDRPGEQIIRLTRFHAVLDPAAMRDITFRDAKENLLMGGRFLINLDDEWRRPGLAPAGLFLAGLGMAAVASGRPRRRPWLRCAAAGLVLLGLCCL
jgi:hypothetical protein